MYSIDVHHDPVDSQKSKVAVLLSTKLQLYQGLNITDGENRGRRRRGPRKSEAGYDVIRMSKVPPKWNAH